MIGVQWAGVHTWDKPRLISEHQDNRPISSDFNMRSEGWMGNHQDKYTGKDLSAYWMLHHLVLLFFLKGKR